MTEFPISVVFDPNHRELEPLEARLQVAFDELRVQLSSRFSEPSIETGSAVSGQVLVADGSGGSVFVTLYRTGTLSISTDGAGAGTQTVTHNLGTTPSVVTPVHTATDVGQLAITAKGSTTFTVEVANGPVSSTVAGDWIAFR